MTHAAESGNTAAITLLLDLGFPVDARGDDGGTPLHAAAYSGVPALPRPGRVPRMGAVRAAPAGHDRGRDDAGRATT